MAEKAKILKLKHHGQENQLDLDSGHQIRVKETSDEEILEIVEPAGEIVMKIRLTADGPVVSLQGARLELNSTESIKLESKNIEINASQQATVQSDGNLQIGSTNQLDIKSADDIVVVGKMVHIN